MSTATSISVRASAQSRTTTLLPLIAALGCALSLQARAATIAVNSASEGSVSGACTLVDAVAALNAQEAVSGCAAGDGNDDTIDLTGFKQPTTISLTQSPSGLKHALVLNKPAAILGGRAADGTPYVTLERSSASGTPDFGLILSLKPLTVNGLTMQNGLALGGYCGGAILAGDALVVSNSVLRANNVPACGGGAISAGNGLTLRNSLVTGNSSYGAGGGIEAMAALNVYDSTISNNSISAPNAVGGGGIYALGAINMHHSVISANRSSTDGGGIYGFTSLTMSDSTVSNNMALNGGGGGARVSYNGVSISGSTISGNSASADGGGVSATSADITNSTFVANTAHGDGGGVYAYELVAAYATLAANTAQTGEGGGFTFSSSATLNGTLVYGNHSSDVGSIRHVAVNGAFNLVGSAPWGVPVDTLHCDAHLGALTDNGGATLTMLPGAGSCAIDAASPTPSASTDQRGYMRPDVSGTRADIGAVETGAGAAATSADHLFGSGYEH